MADIKIFEQNLSALAAGLRTELQSIRGSRPSPKMVEDIRVDVYGQSLPVKAVGSISVVPPREIQISVWDRSLVNIVAKAIETSNLRVVANVDGNTIRINLPTLTDERKKELDKVIRKMVEETRIKVRAARDEANKEIKSQETGGALSEDAAFKARESIQKIVDKINQEIEAVLDNKIKEISD